jgi:hypothetical protein
MDSHDDIAVRIAGILRIIPAPGTENLIRLAGERSRDRYLKCVDLFVDLVWATLENRDEAEAGESGIRSYYGRPPLGWPGSASSEVSDRYSQVELVLAEIVARSRIVRA